MVSTGAGITGLIGLGDINPPHKPFVPLAFPPRAVAPYCLFVVFPIVARIVDFKY